MTFEQSKDGMKEEERIWLWLSNDSARIIVISVREREMAHSADTSDYNISFTPGTRVAICTTVLTRRGSNRKRYRVRSGATYIPVKQKRFFVPGLSSIYGAFVKA